MKKFAMVLALAGLSLSATGCATVLGWFGIGGGGGVDYAASMKDTPAQYMVQLHSGAEVGQWASWEAGGSEQWWGVTGEKDGNLVVENRMKMGDSWVTQAFVVDAEGNVQEAYVANYDPEAEELQEGHKRTVAEKKEVEGGKEGPKPETGEETVNAAGKDWNCKWTKVDVNGKFATTWMADDAWFSKVIKSEYDGNVGMMLKETGTDAKLGLKFPGGE